MLEIDGGRDELFELGNVHLTLRPGKGCSQGYRQAKFVEPAHVSIIDVLAAGGVSRSLTIGSISA
jgi:hypothetical protein